MSRTDKSRCISLVYLLEFRVQALLYIYIYGGICIYIFHIQRFLIVSLIFFFSLDSLQNIRGWAPTCADRVRDLEWGNWDL